MNIWRSTSLVPRPYLARTSFPVCAILKAIRARVGFESGTKIRDQLHVSGQCISANTYISFVSTLHVYIQSVVFINIVTKSSWPTPPPPSLPLEYSTVLTLTGTPRAYNKASTELLQRKLVWEEWQLIWEQTYSTNSQHSGTQWNSSSDSFKIKTLSLIRTWKYYLLFPPERRTPR